MDRYIQFAAAAGMEALADAALDLEATDRDRMGVSLGSAVGGTMALEDGYVAVSDRGQEWLVDADYSPPFLYQGLIPSSLASEIALKFGAHGPSVVISTGCTSGIDAIGYGHQMIQDGEADVVISGAAESPDLADLDGLLRPDQGDLGPQRRPGARLAAVRPRP